MASLGGKLARVRLPLLTPRLALRLPRLVDVPFLVRYINDPLVSRPLTTRHARYKRSDEVEWVKSSRRAARKGDKLNLAITLRENGTLVGGVGLEIRDWDNGHGWTGYWLVPQYWHKGYGSEAASAVCQLAFQRLKLHRIDAAVFEFNTRSMKLLQRLGFKREGKKREILRRGGRWYDEVAFGLLAEDFRPISYGD
jgi:[ribosomal protein S5]-alanine N-acetyltransferase